MGLYDNAETTSTASQNRAERRANRGGPASDKPKAQFWANIGEYDEDMGRFINLAYGIPLDAIEDVPESGSDEWREFRAEQNFLRDDVLADLQDMEPGEERILNLQIRVRRVKDEAPVQRTRRERKSLSSAV